MEVERREEVEEEGGELVQAVEHLNSYIIYQYISHHILKNERDLIMIYFIIVYISHYFSKTVEDLIMIYYILLCIKIIIYQRLWKTRLFCHITIADIRVPIHST